MVATSVLVLIAACAPAPTDSHDAAFPAIETVVQATMEEEGTPGLALAVTSDTELLYAGYFGYADLAHRRPVTEDTLFQIGSITKSFTALALMHLWDEGRFDPATPIAELVPWFEVQTEFAPITGHHLLTHTAGIPANRDDIYGSRYMAWALREQRTAWPPGEKFYYSNVGYQVLHVLLEELSGESYADLIERLIFEPLDMDRSRAAIRLDSRREQAVGYLPPYDDRPHHPSRALVEAPFLEYGLGDGCIQSTATDLAAYARMLLNRGRGPGGRLVSEEAFDLFSTPHVEEPGGASAGYGYGISTQAGEGRELLHHSGGMVGLSAFMVIDQTEGTGMVVLVNGPADVRTILTYADAALKAAARGEAPPPLPERVDPALVENAADYAGEYTTQSGQTLVFVRDGPRLRLVTGDDTVVLGRRGEDAFLALHPAFDRYTFDFGRDDTGAVVEVTHGPLWLAHPRYTGPTEFETPREWAAYVGRYRSYSPWVPYFEVIERKGRLLAVMGEGGESAFGEVVLEPREPGVFHPGEDPSPEILRFEGVVDGQALRAAWSGHGFYRLAW